MNNVILFEKEDFGRVRTVVDNIGDVYFVAKDIAEILGYTKLDAMYRRLDNEEMIKINPQSIETAGFPHEVGIQLESNPNVKILTMINESGLYSSVLGSKLPSAIKFQKWVTKEVLPSIRKNGGYITNQENMTSEQILANAVLLAQNIIAEKDRLLLVMKPKAEYFDRVLDTTSEYTTTQIAKECLMSGKALNFALGHEGIQYKQNGQWLLYAKYQDKGYTRTRTTLYKNSEGIEKTNHLTVWTEKGREFIIDVIESL